MKYKTFLKVLFSLYMALLTIPFLQSRLHLIISKNLRGDFNSTAFQPYTFANWIEGSFQQNTEKYLNENFGLRSDFVRLNNQFDFSFFKHTNCDVVLGKDDYMFQMGYINSVNGNDIITNALADSFVEKIKYVTDQLKYNGTDLLLVIPPSKANYYYEKLPDRFIMKKRSITNYDLIKTRLKQMNLNVIDFSEYFRKIKFNTRYPLFPKYGIHWSTYGAAIAGDSIVKYIENLRQIDLNDMYWKDNKISSIAELEDNDLEELLNLILKSDGGNLAYPILEFENNPSKPKPNVLFVGDSYYFQIMQQGIFRNIFNSSSFWFYFNKIYDNSWLQSGQLNRSNFIKEVINKDVVILIYNESLLHPEKIDIIDSLFQNFKINEFSIKDHSEKIITDSLQTEK